MHLKDLKRRSEIAQKALAIVRKFPQIEQEVIVPMLAKEIGIAILKAQDETAIQCSEICREESDRAPGGLIPVGSAARASDLIRRLYGLEDIPRKPLTDHGIQKHI